MDACGGSPIRVSSAYILSSPLTHLKRTRSLLTISHLQRRNSQTPQIRFTIIPPLHNHLGRHPKRRAHKRVPHAPQIRQLGRDAEIGELDLAG